MKQRPRKSRKRSTTSVLTPKSVVSPLNFIASLHRGGDSYVTFHQKTIQFKNLFSIRASYLKQELHRHAPHLLKDSYFSLNGFWRTALKQHKPTPFIKNVYARKETALQYLNAVYSDIDCYNMGIDPGTALAKISALVKNKSLPPPSCGLTSRGVWLLWLLKEGRDPNIPPRSKGTNLRTYKMVTKKIRDLLQSVGADPGAVDAARIVRIPGSINSKNGAPVKVLWPATGAPVFYTLRRLVALLGLKPPAQSTLDWALINRATKALLRRTSKGSSQSTKVNPWTKVNRQRLLQFQELWKLRNGFSAGLRAYAALIYARLLTTCGASPTKVRADVTLLGQHCKPPLTPAEINGAVKSGTQRRSNSIANATISSWLQITWNEHIALKSTFGRYAWKPAAGQQIPLTKAQSRRQMIQRIVKKHGMLSVRNMAGLLSKTLHAVSPTQVAKDYRALKLTRAQGMRKHP
jgi:hypothetical protein